MIITEHFDIDGRDFIRTYSNTGCYVVRDGVEYSEACDPAEFGRTYTEGNKMPQEEIESQAEDILNIILGGEQE